MGIPLNIRCVYCGKSKEKKEFAANYSQYHQQQKMFFCRQCTKEITTEMFKKAFSTELFVREMCNIFHMPYVTKAMEDLRVFLSGLTGKGVERKDFDFVVKYLQLLKENNVPEDMWKSLNGLDFTLKKFTNKVAIKTDDYVALDKLVEFWGVKDKLEYYLFLEKRYAVYTHGQKLQPSTETTIKYLCEAELDARILKETKADQKEISTVEKRVSDFYKRLGLDDHQFEDNKTIAEKHIEKWIYITEKTRPISYLKENPELLDKCRLGADFDDILRAVDNKVNKKTNFPTVDGVNLV